VDERLLEEVNLGTKLPTAKVSFHTDKDVKVVKKLASLEKAGGIGFERNRDPSHITGP